MKITTISDLHGYLPLLDPCDVVCICGDISPIEFDRNKYRVREWFTNKFIPWVNLLNCDKVIFIAGNHDWFLFVNDDGYSVKQVIEVSSVKDKLIYLENQEYVYQGVKFYGCPNVEHLVHWAFYTWDGHEYKYIPKDTDILLTHMAPSIGELGRDMTLVREFGSIRLAKVIQNLPKLQYAFCGHIHDGDHRVTQVNQVKCINCSILDDNYERTYDSKTVELDIFELPSRDGDKNYLLFTGREDDLLVYELRLEHDLGMRVIFGDDPEEIVAIDPSGGPFISVGNQMKFGEQILELVEINDLQLKFKNAKDEEIV